MKEFGLTDPSDGTDRSDYFKQILHYVQNDNSRPIATQTVALSALLLPLFGGRL